MSDELLSILKEHILKYPDMQIRDAVKLVYQNELGPGHMVKSEAESLRRLEAELPGAPAGSPLFEDIGNGLCRLYLGPLKKQELAIGTANRFFLHTANTHRGSIPRLEEKLIALVEGCRTGELPFAAEEAEAFIQECRRQGYPPIGHSEDYRQHYAPAYRVVKTAFRDYFALFARIDALLKIRETVNVAIDGMSCAGKSSLAALLEQVYDCNVIHMDDFFLPQAMKTPERLAQPGGNVHYERFLTEVLTPLLAGRPFCYRPFDCKSQTFREAVSFQPKPLNIIEGAYSLHPTLADAYQLKVFLEIDPEIQSARILQRNGPAMHRRFMEEWVPLANRYVQECNIKERCDLVLS
jgi:uridine kinase